MKKKLIGIFICVIFIGTTIIPSISGNIDKIGDTKNINYLGNLDSNIDVIFEDDFNAITDNYGFIIPVNSSQTIKIQNYISRLINDLLRNNICVYWINSNISILSTRLNENIFLEKHEYETGSFIISFSEESDRDKVAISIVDFYEQKYNLEIYTIIEPVSKIEVFRLVEPKVAYHDGDIVYSSSYVNCLAEGGFTDGIKLDWKNISKKLNNNDFNVFIWGGLWGNTSIAIKTQIRNMLAITTIRRFVRDGGGYVGSCYGGYEIATGSHIMFNRFKPYFPRIPSLFFTLFSTRFVLKALPGFTQLTIEITDSSSPITYGLPKKINHCIYKGGPMFLGLPGNTKTIAIIEDIDINRLELNNDNLPQFLLDFWISFVKGKPIWVTTEFEDGKVIAFGDHPENHFYNRIVHNAVFYASSKGPYTIEILKNKSLSNIEIINNSFDNINIFEGI